ncbi:MAG: hypothetical protein NT062_21080 [Proteobacteria bacterium]|nr:hypothetical protein [Pseudomonadota bacterium]
MRTRADELVGSVERLTDALALRPRDLGLVRELARACGWGDDAIATPWPPSSVSHGVPWGVSTAIGEPEVRVFLEARDRPAADAVTALMARHGADLAPWEALAVPADLRVWHAVAFTPDAPPRWHAYACLDRPDRVALPAVTLPARARVTIASVDLAPGGRRKVYALIPDCTIAELAAIHDQATTAVPGEAERFARVMLGGERTIWWLVCFQVAAGASTCALHFHVPRHADDATARDRLHAYLGAPPPALGAYHFITYQRRAGRPRVTTYFLPEAHR